MYRDASGEKRKSAKVLRLRNLGKKTREPRTEHNLVNKCLGSHCPQFFMQYFFFKLKLDCTKKAFFKNQI